MFEASPKNFLRMYFSGLRVQSEVYMIGWRVVEWWDEDYGERILLVNPETHHRYLKFVEDFEKNKPLLTELR